MDGWKYISEIVRGLAERARKVTFRGESPHEEWHGHVEAMSGRDGVMELHISRAHKKKYGGKKWYTDRVTVTLSREAWEHLRTASVDEAR